MIQDQVKLPIGVAFEVAKQGIRMRFGRSVVTVMGVLLGVAFLMSILTAQVIKKGVKYEADLRAETQRMYSFLTAEMGPARDRTIGLIQVGPLNEGEARLLRRIGDEHVGQILWYKTAPNLPAPPAVKEEMKPVELDGVAQNASAVLIMGKGETPKANWDSLLRKARNRVVCASRKANLFPAREGLAVVSLERELREDEKARREAEERKDHFRNGWIITISILVTVICISNSLLMSVTERFKEIGTMKCLGALSSFIRRLFLIESSMIGLVGSVVGSLFGCLFSILMYAFTFGVSLVASSLAMGTLLLYLLLCVVIGLTLSVVAAIYPATFAARMLPGVALRTNI